MKVVLLGMNNPLSADPRFALYPLPAGSAGGRLWAMLHACRPDLRRANYVTGFLRWNLVEGPSWDAGRARAMARQMWSALAGHTVIMLGEEVRRAMGVREAKVIHPTTVGQTVVRQLPHPSGRCLWYNHPTNRLLAGLLLSDMYEEGLR